LFALGVPECLPAKNAMPEINFGRSVLRSKTALRKTLSQTQNHFMKLLLHQDRLGVTQWPCTVHANQPAATDAQNAATHREQIPPIFHRLCGYVWVSFCTLLHDTAEKCP
jgi:Na+-transporting NADH:ubiquinone oxidoreductase subunit NqrF